MMKRSKYRIIYHNVFPSTIDEIVGACDLEWPTFIYEENPEFQFPIPVRRRSKRPRDRRREKKF